MWTQLLTQALVLQPVTLYTSSQFLCHCSPYVQRSIHTHVDMIMCYNSGNIIPKFSDVPGDPILHLNIKTYFSQGKSLFIRNGKLLYKWMNVIPQYTNDEQDKHDSTSRTDSTSLFEVHPQNLNMYFVVLHRDFCRGTLIPLFTTKT